jgi:hypothetical protein
MMQLSGEQTHAAMAGLGGTLSWARVERPLGPQPLPDWVKGAEVNWHDEYSNSPSVRLLVRGDVREWPGKVFAKEGNRFIARHEDGRAEQYSHDGVIEWTKINFWKGVDGSVHRSPRYDVSLWPTTYGYEPGDWVPVDAWATPKQGGFGGSTIWVTLIDGREVALRGPWHVGAPEGYAGVSYCDRSVQFGSRAGLFITQDLLVRILARFQAHLELARVDYGYAKGIEVMKPEWDAPKAVMMARERRAAA